MKWFASVLLILFVALVLEAGLLAYAMYVLLALLLTSRFVARYWINHLSAERACQRLTAEVGETVPVNVTITNDGVIPVAWVLLEDMLPARREGRARGLSRLSVKGERIQIRMIRSLGQAMLIYSLKLKMRGYYQIGPLLMETGDLFGLHRRYRAAADPQFLLVYPKVVPLQGFDIASRRPVGEIRLSHRLFEDPTRISGVREYQAGDPLNRIHWRASARTGELHCKVYEPSTIAGLTLLLDFHQEGYHERGEPFRSDLAVTATVSLANAVFEMGQQVGLITNGRDAAERIRQEGWEEDYRTRKKAKQSLGMLEKNERLQPLIVETRRGVEQFQRIREMLARVELTDGLTFAELVVECTARLPRDATVVAVLAQVSPETAMALGSLKRHGFAVTAVLILLDDDNGLDQAYGRLLAEGIRDVRHLKSEAELPTLCQNQILRAAPYTMVTEY